MPVRQIVCMKWGTSFGASDVNRLQRMIGRHLSGDFRLTCLTDAADGIDSAIRCLPLPSVPIVGHLANRGWRKLGLFGPELASALDGTVLYLDLDVAITASIDPYFDIDGDFLIIKDFRPLRYRHRFTGNSSVLRFTTGAHPGLLAELTARGDAVRRDFRDEQEFVSDYMRRQSLLQYWPRDWCASYKHQCVRPLPLGLWQAPRLPVETRIVVFHGRPKLEEAVAGLGSKWYRPVRPAPWLRNYID